MKFLNSYCGRKDTNRTLFAEYSILFFLAALVVYYPFILFGKNFLWDVDGIFQHFNAFVFYGKYLREIARNLISGKTEILPMFSFSIGYGGDILSTLSYYIIGDPFALLSAFIPAKYAELGYAAVIILRLYTAGLVFCLYARKMNCGRTGTVCGAIAYCFCGYALEAAVRHPYFTNPMIWLPLIYLGIEKILQKGRPFLYIAAVFMAAVSNFYFFYMIVIATVLYAFFRGGETLSWNIPNLFKLAGKMLFYSIIGVLMAAFLFLPSAMAYLGCSRGTKTYVFDMFYRLQEYEAYPSALISETQATEWAFLGYTPVVILSIICAFLNKTGKRWHKWMLSLYFLFLLLPVFGYALNGFGYVANRWVFALSLIACYCLANNAEELLQLRGRKTAFMTLFCAGYAVILLLLEKSRTENTMASMMVMLLTLVILLTSEEVFELLQLKVRLERRKYEHIAIIAVTLLGVMVNGVYKNSYFEENYVKEFGDAGTALETLEGGDCCTIDLVDDQDFYRVSSIRNGFAEYNYNYPLYKDYKTTTMYWSMVPKLWSDFLSDNLAYEFTVNSFIGLEARTMLLPLFSAKYYTGRADQEKLIPYGYREVDYTSTEKGEWRIIYETDNSLPLGYTYDTYLTEEEYLSMTPVQRQQSMLQTATVNPEEIKLPETIRQISPEFTDRKILYNYAEGTNTEIAENRIIAKKENTAIVLEGDFPAETELYLYIKGLNYEYKPSNSFVSEEEISSWPAYWRRVTEITEKDRIPPTSTGLTASAGNGNSATLIHYTEKDIYSHGREDYLLNMYYCEEPREKISVVFSAPGIYTFDEMSVIAQPMDNLEEYVTALSEEPLQDIKIDTNTVTGSVELSKDKILCLSIPYSEGWKIYVDGDETKAFAVNRMFLGTVVSEGKHTVELKYRTPFLKEGTLLSVLGAVLLVLTIITDKGMRVSRKRRNY